MSVLDRLLKVREKRWLDEHVCLAPFTHFEIAPNGNVYSCCPGTLKGDLPIGNLFEMDPSQIWNSGRAEEIRASVVDGTFRFCRPTCQDLASRNIPRKNDVTLDFGKLPARNLFSMPTYIVIAADPTCNLCCPSCRGEPFGLDSHQRQRLAESLENAVKPLLKQCKLLKMLGSGEVFASPTVSSFLKSLDHGSFPNLRLELLTNGQLLDRARWEEFSNIHRMVKIINVSIDAATERTYQRIRPGASWNKLVDNMKFIAQLRKEGFCEHLVINFTVQDENYREMLGFVGLGQEWSVDEVYFSRLMNWGTFTQDGYKQRDVCGPKHPDHKALVKLLKDGRFRAHEPQVKLNNLEPLLGSRVSVEGT